MRDAEVVVVGAGPAGTAAAITLSRAGREVLVVDRARFPRDKCCGDGLTAGALRRLEGLGLRPGTVGSWTVVEGVSVRSPSGRVAELPLPTARGAFAAVARRVDLDGAMVRLARQSGATVLEETALVAATTGRSSVRLGFADGTELSARHVVGADGMWSALRKAASTGQDSYLGDWHAMRQYFTDVGPEARSRMWVWFEPGILPGYAWSFPLSGGRANVGFGIRRRPGRPTGEMAKAWKRLLELPHVREILGPAARPQAQPRTWPIPTSPSGALLSAAGGRILFAGDAARVGDPLTGEGIAQAAETGVLAAEAVLSTPGGDPAEVSRRYRQGVAKALVADARMSEALSRLLRSELGARASVRVASLSPAVRSRFARWLLEDYPRALLATPSRWGRGAMSAPGAFRFASQEGRRDRGPGGP